MAGCGDLCMTQMRGDQQQQQQQRYGVRSYLHLFYEDCTGSMLEDDEPDELNRQRSSSGWRSALWKVGLSAGTILFLVGLATVTTGYLVPPKIEGIGEADFLVVDRRAIEYNEALEVSKLVGAILFSVGGTAIAACILVLTLSRHPPKDEERQFSPILKRGPPETKHKMSLTTGSPGDAQIPVSLSRVQSIQPKTGT
ncbi:neurensin-1-like isoform X1 [Hemiscyllium ocellatum]|uniref:neurensin-1-like isoform X1 n=1 Tax=Hemiscyllium ocellatum TaxID=170820 RepID=UPI002966FA54|nr:neurensin-1-like isoform X1 [Hemiscyllium ocellatum]